jgi:hypothetical protein
LTDDVSLIVRRRPGGWKYHRGRGNVGAVPVGQRAAARCARPIVRETLSHTLEELVDFDDVHEDVEQQLEALVRVDRRRSARPRP